MAMATNDLIGMNSYYYHTPRQALWFDLLSLHVVRGFAVVKLLRLPWVKQLSAWVQARLFRPLVEAEGLAPAAAPQAHAGMLLVVARKSVADAAPARR
jgi:hypothetical protein